MSPAAALRSRCRSSHACRNSTVSCTRGVVVAALDSACGYAALTLMPADMEVLTAELKVKLLAHASGDSLVAEGQVGATQCCVASARGGGRSTHRRVSLRGGPLQRSR
jgi:acyl-coenzyme A thioesterase PaaI-like protein